MERKRMLSLCLALLLFFTPLLSACAPNAPAEGTAAVTAPETAPETMPETTPETIPETAPETTPETTPETDPADDFVRALTRLKQSFPRTDGTTSTLPLANAIREAICGPDHTPASHTTTYTAFYNLIHKSNDLIFSVPISAGRSPTGRRSAGTTRRSSPSSATRTAGARTISRSLWAIPP